jgi:hypothetical protein
VSCLIGENSFVDVWLDCYKIGTSSNTITQPVFTALSCATRAAKHLAGVFHTVADNVAPAITTLRRHLLNRALEAIEDVRFPSEYDLECLVVVVSAMFAFSHKVCSFLTFRFV